MSRKGQREYHRKRQRAASRARAENAALANPATGLGGGQDRSSVNARPLPHVHYNPFRDAGIGFAAGTAYDLYAGDWMAQKLVDLPVFDVFREGWNWKYKGNDTEVDERLQDEADRLDVLDVFQKSMRMERILGGAAVVMVMREGEGVAAEQPIDLATVRQGDLLALNEIGRNYITKCEWNWQPGTVDYGRPTHYWINGVKYHRSRLILFDGNPVSPHPGLDFAADCANWDGFGLSVYATMYDSLVRAMETQQGASHLVNTSSVWAVIVKNLRDIQLSKCGGRQLSELERMVSEMSNYRAIMLQGQDADIKQLSASFGSVPELVMSFLQIVCAGADIPASRFLGTAPSGLNTDGDSWQESYYASIEVKRKLNVERKFRNSLLPVLCSSVFGPGVVDPRKITTEWPELRTMSEPEKAEVRALDVKNALDALNAGLLSATEAQRELVAKKVFSITPSERELAEREAEKDRFVARGEL